MLASHVIANIVRILVINEWLQFLRHISMDYVKHDLTFSVSSFANEILTA